MKYLLDTHVLLWFLTENCENMSEHCQEILLDEQNTLYFSKVSVWEMSIKYSLGKPDFDYNPQEIVNELLRLGFRVLDIDIAHLYAIVDLAWIHRDPFDRLLIVQAELEKMQFLTADSAILQYDKPFLLDTRTI